MKSIEFQAVASAVRKLRIFVAGKRFVLHILRMERNRIKNNVRLVNDPRRNPFLRQWCDEAVNEIVLTQLGLKSNRRKRKPVCAN